MTERAERLQVVCSRSRARGRGSVDPCAFTLPTHQPGNVATYRGVHARDIGQGRNNTEGDEAQVSNLLPFSSPSCDRMADSTRQGPQPTDRPPRMERLLTQGCFASW